MAQSSAFCTSSGIGLSMKKAVCLSEHILSLSLNYLKTYGLVQSLGFTVLVIHLIDLQPLLHICAGYKGYIPISDVKLQLAT